MAEQRGRKRPGSGFSENEHSIKEEDKEPLNEVKRTPILDRDFNNRTQEFIGFENRFVRAMLSNVKVLMIGDSLMRGLYKDLITWTQSNSLTVDAELKRKSEASYLGDRQIDISLLTDDKVFRQSREYQTDTFLIQFLFTTRVMKDDMDSLIQQMLGKDGYPDVILINSMIWDLTRYFKVSTDTAYSDSSYQKKIEIECIQKYLDRTSMLLRRMRAILPPHTMVIWVNFPHCRPSMPDPRGRGRGMQMEPLSLERNHFIRSVMIDGSFRVSQLVRNAGYDVLDLGFYMRNHAFYHYQKLDGMHWLPAGVRLMSQLIIQFLAKSWGINSSQYIRRLEEKQAPYPLKLAATQLKTHAYYTDVIPKLQHSIAKRTFENLRTTHKYSIENLIQGSRALLPIVRPPRKLQREKRFYNPPTGGPITTRVEKIRLAIPRIDREKVREIDELATKLQAVSTGAIDARQ